MTNQIIILKVIFFVKRHKRSELLTLLGYLFYVPCTFVKPIRRYRHAIYTALGKCRKFMVYIYIHSHFPPALTWIISWNLVFLLLQVFVRLYISWRIKMKVYSENKMQERQMKKMINFFIIIINGGHCHALRSILVN
jgi:hypothetical protein